MMHNDNVTHGELYAAPEVDWLRLELRRRALGGMAESLSAGELEGANAGASTGPAAKPANQDREVTRLKGGAPPRPRAARQRGRTSTRKSPGYHAVDEGPRDALRLYLRRVDTATKMTREDELAAGKRIEEAEHEALAALLQTPLAHQLIANLKDRLRAGERPSDAEVQRVVSRMANLCRSLDRAREPLLQWADALNIEAANLIEWIDATPRRRARLCKQLGLTSARYAELQHAVAVLRDTEKEVQEQAGSTVEELRQSFAAIRRGEERAAAAKADLIETHLRDVVFLARRYAERGLPMLDLIQEGNIGLMTAANKYDYKLGYRFSTYANWWIRQSMGRALADQGRTIRLPVHRTEALSKIGRARRFLRQELGREPTAPEIARTLEVPEDRIEELLQWARNVVSLETPVGAEQEGNLAELIANPNAELPSAAVMAADLATQTREQMAILTPREQEVLSLRFGIDSGAEMTLEEIGKQFGVTRERIRQIEAKALSKLRHPSRAKALKGFVD